MSWWRRGSSSADLVEKRCWKDSDLDTLADRLEDAARPVPEKVSAVLARLGAARDDAEQQLLVLDASAERLAGDLAAVREALSEGDPGADERADRLALDAAVTTSAAWNVRGGGGAETVGEDAWPVFHRMLEEADERGRQALDLVADHPGAATWRLVSGRGLGLPSDEWWHRFEVARRRRPTLYPAHFHMLQALCEKWYGTHDLMLDFGRRVARESPVGDPLPAVLALAHLELWLATASGGAPQQLRDRARAEDTALLRQVSDAWLATGEAASAHPRALEAHQLFGWFFQDDRSRAAAHLSRVGGRIAFFPWQYYKEPHAEYRRQLDLAKVRG